MDPGGRRPWETGGVDEAEPDWEPHARVVVPWRQQVERGPRADRVLREIEVREPPRIAGAHYDADRPLASSMANALAGLRQLDGSHGRRLRALNRLLLRTESVASSKIENIEASLADYGKAVLGARSSASAVSMAAATDALTGIITQAEVSGVLGQRSMQDAHAVLFRRSIDQQHNAGRFRTVQNWIGGSDYTPRNALYVPPPPALVPELLEDLFAFANRDDVPVLVQAAVAHAQFESIHPFVDGNGRIGRTLIHAVLRRRRVTTHLTVPIASALVAHREKYFDALGDYREGQARPIIAMLTGAVIVATHESRRTATALHEIRQDWDQRLGPVRRGSPVHRVLVSLPEFPTVTVTELAERLDLDLEETTAAVDVLRAADVLVPASRGVSDRVSGRGADRVWSARDILDELTDLNDRIVAVSRLRDR
ncbi:MAG: Fic family protein [Actinomycetales bacterium]|nr:MAG: Fic family protein [Actinomycetales bacterium]